MSKLFSIEDTYNHIFIINILHHLLIMANILMMIDLFSILFILIMGEWLIFVRTHKRPVVWFLIRQVILECLNRSFSLPLCILAISFWVLKLIFIVLATSAIFFILIIIIRLMWDHHLLPLLSWAIIIHATFIYSLTDGFFLILLKFRLLPTLILQHLTCLD